jgi:hypothetical protein
MSILCRLSLLSVLAVLALVAATGHRDDRKELRPLIGTGQGTLRGKITIEGMPAGIEERNKALREAMQKKDAEHCLSPKAPPEHTRQQTWRIARDGGLANVFVWLRPPRNTFFRIDPDRPTWPGEVVLDQPYCAYEPHALVLFTAYTDPANPRKRKGTGQRFVVTNTSPIYHNVNWQGGPDNPGDNRLVLPGRKLLVDLEPSERPVVFRCDLHTWMSAYVRVFDHPHATISRKDGTYEINNVPAGVDLRIVVWHEAAGYVTSEDGEAIKLEDGKVLEKNFKVKAQ